MTVFLAGDDVGLSLEVSMVAAVPVPVPVVRLLLNRFSRNCCCSGVKMDDVRR